MEEENGTLVLSRYVGERIRIGKDIWIQLIETHRNRARLAITAPRDVLILREEVIQKE